jgi:hypothetical protein
MLFQKKIRTKPTVSPEDKVWQDCYEYLSNMEPARFSPDLHKLCEHYIQLLFVMDQLNVDDKELLNKDVALKLGYGFTAEKYSFWRKKLGRESFGIPLENCKFHAVPVARIKGTLYAISVPQFYEKLDFYYQNGVLYERKRIRTVIPYVREIIKHDGTIELDRRSCFVRAWAYFGKKDYWYSQLDAGFRFAPVHCFGNKRIVATGETGLNKMPYFRFTSLELKD